MEPTLAILNDLVARGVIEKYAIGGAVGAIFWVEPFDTVDLDVFVFLPADSPPLDPLRRVFADLQGRGYQPVVLVPLHANFGLRPTEH